MIYSKSSADKAARYDLKRCFSSAFLFPSAAMLILSKVCLEDAFFDSHIWGDFNYVIFNHMHTSEMSLYTTLYMLAGALTAIHMFSFLISTKRCNVYLSMGITRLQLYKNRVISSLVYMIISVIVPMVISYIGNILYYNITAELIQALIYFALSFLSVMLLGFAIGSIFTVSTGNIFESTAYSAIGCFLPTIVFTSVAYILGKLVNGSAYTTSNQGVFGDFADYCKNITDFSNAVNPIYYLNNVAELIGYEDVGAEKYTPTAANWLSTIAWFIIFALLTVLAQRLFYKRKAEIAGSFGGNKSAIIFAASTLAVLIFSLVCNFMQYNKIATYILCVIAPALVYIIVIALVFRNKDDIRNNIKGALVTAGLSSVMLVICLTGMFGIYTSIPAAEDIEYVLISPAAGDPVLGTESGMCLNTTPPSYGELTDKDDIAFALSLQKKVIDSLGKGDNNVGFVYKLKSGLTIVRHYRDISDEAAKESLNVTQTKWYKDTVYDMLTNENFDLHKAYSKLPEVDLRKRNIEAAQWGHKNELIEKHNRFSDFHVVLLNSTLSKGLVISNEFSKNEITEFRKALATDLISMTPEEMFFPKEKALYHVDFLISEELPSGKQTFSSDSGGDEIPIYPSMVNTMKILREHGISLEDITSEDVVLVEAVPYKTMKEKGADGIDRDINNRHDKTDRLNYGDEGSLEYHNALFSYLNKDFIKSYTDRETIDRYFASFKSMYSVIGDNGKIVRFIMKDDSFIVAYVPEVSS